MTYRRTIILLFIIAPVIFAEPKCSRFEDLDDCPTDCPYDNCPKNELQDKQVCPRHKNKEDCPPPACKCWFNYRRAENGTCIPTTKCPAFECSRPHEVYDPCPPYCPSEHCRDAALQGQCPYLLLIVVYCVPACRCEEGYARNDEGICVPYKECYKENTINI